MEILYSNDETATCVTVVLNDEDVKKPGYNYKSNVMADNKIHGLIAPTILSCDGKIMFKYRVKHCYIFGKLASAGMVDKKMLKKLTRVIQDKCNQLRNYMLTEDDILFSSDCIFYNKEKDEFFFLYVPCYGMEFRKQFMDVIGLVMKKFDHGNREDTYYLYEVYDRVSKGDYRFGEEEIEETARKEFECIRETNYEPFVISEIDEEKIKLFGGKKNKIILATGLGVVAVGFVVFLLIFRDLLLFACTGIWGSVIIVKGAFYEDEEEEIDTAMEEYELIQENAKKKEEKLFEVIESKSMSVEKLVPLTNGKLPELELKYDREKIVVGRGKNKNNYTINSTPISREHATLYRDGDMIFIEDNESTNGTFINDTKIPPLKCYIIKKGDIISFANENFIAV